jgi:hypothetical protein
MKTEDHEQYVRLVDAVWQRENDTYRTPLKLLGFTLVACLGTLIYVLADKPLPAPIKIPDHYTATTNTTAIVSLDQSQVDQLLKALKPTVVERIVEKPVIRTVYVQKPAKQPKKWHKRPLLGKPAQPEPFVPPIQKNCPAGYEERQPGACFNSKLKRVIFL